MIKNNRLNQVCWATAIAVTAIAGFNSAALAQGSNDDGYQSNEKSGIYGDAPSGLDPLDIIHRAQQINGRSAVEFDRESQAQIDNSALDFKRLQQQRILEQQQSQQPVTKEKVNSPATSPATIE
ncbi:MAG: hypothetical protein HC930_07555 [Hydrococcus sp. SU_1_0]|nr:hypothetical protein [Hydrococcus sp. SU_1_0]